MASLIKCVVLGNSKAGKTSLLRTYIDKTFHKNPPPTIYVEYAVETPATLNGSSKSLKLCDATGAEEYDCAKRLCYPNTDVFLICFSVAEPDCSEDIREYYLSDIRMCCPDVPIVLVGTKVDLREEEDAILRSGKSTAVSYDEGLRLAQEIGAMEYLECSALTGSGVAAVFDVVAACGEHYRSIYGVKPKKSKCSLM